MKTIKRQIISLIFCLLFCVISLPASAFAYDEIDTQAKCSLSISFAPNGEAAQNVNFRLYRVADVFSDGVFLTESFKKYPVVFEQDEDTWRNLAITLSGYVYADSISSDYSAITSADGVALFKDLPVGIYLVIADVYKSNNTVYIPQSFLVSLPGNDVNNALNYNVTANVKYDFFEEHEQVNVDVLKVWKGSSEHPKSVTVELYNGAQLYDTVVLDKSNNWQHKWEKLNSDGNWNIVEKSVFNGYVVSADKQNNSFVITNSSLEVTYPPSDSAPPESSERLPQTGLLWWPVPMFIAAGLVLIIIGYIRSRGSAYEK